MFNFSSPLFWFKFVFLAEIVTAEALIIYRMKRKSRFWLRAAGAAAALFAFTFALPIPFYNAIYASLLFMMIFGATLCALKFCFREPWGSIIYCGFFSYNQQHISFQLYSLLCIPFGIDATNNIYGGVMGDSGGGLQVLVFIVPHVIVYLSCWALLAYRAYRRNSGEFVLKNYKVMLFAIAIVFVNVVLNAFVVYDLPVDTPSVVHFIIVFYNVFGCILALIMLISVVGQEELASELEIVENLWHKNEQIYELSKENVDFINRKCHDLRHRLRSVRGREFVDEGELEEIEQAIDIYDGVLQTGNKVLDVIISEESIYCNNRGIKLLCNIDGAQLSFIGQTDLYSLFQNGIHNAIDAVLKIGDPDRRIIRINVKRIEKMISVHIENYVAEEEKIEFVNGLPVSRRDKNYHGYGMRSMQISVEKYGGWLCADLSEGIFSLDIMIPVPSGAQEAEQVAALPAEEKVTC